MAALWLPAHYCVWPPWERQWGWCSPYMCRMQSWTQGCCPVPLGTRRPSAPEPCGAPGLSRCCLLTALDRGRVLRWPLESQHLPGPSACCPSGTQLCDHRPGPVKQHSPSSLESELEPARNAGSLVMMMPLQLFGFRIMFSSIYIAFYIFVYMISLASKKSFYSSPRNQPLSKTLS